MYQWKIEGEQWFNQFTRIEYLNPALSAYHDESQVRFQKLKRSVVGSTRSSRRANIFFRWVLRKVKGLNPIRNPGSRTWETLTSCSITGYFHSAWRLPALILSITHSGRTIGIPERLRRSSFCVLLPLNGIAVTTCVQLPDKILRTCPPDSVTIAMSCWFVTWPVYPLISNIVQTKRNIYHQYTERSQRYPLFCLFV